MADAPWGQTSWAKFFAVAVVWGFNYLFVKVGLAFASPLWLAALRAALGAIVAFAIVRLRGTSGRLNGRGRRDALLLGVPNTALFFGLWFVAAESVPPGLAAVLVYTYPVWVAVLSLPVLGHRLRGRDWFAVGAGFVGVALVSGFVPGSSAGVPPSAVVELLAGAISWAVGTVLVQRRFAPVEMAEANAFQVLGGAVALLAVTAVAAPLPLPSFTLELGAAVLWLGVLGTGVAYALWFSLLGTTRAARLSAFVFLVPVVALAASAALLGERLTTVQLAGVGVVLLAVYATGSRSREGSPGAPPPRAAAPGASDPEAAGPPSESLPAVGGAAGAPTRM